MARAEAKIKEGAQPFLKQGEAVLAAIVARPRGWAPEENVTAAESSGFKITSPMALAVTDRRLLCFKISVPVGLGIGGDVEELVSEAPLSDVDSIEVKRVGVGRTVTVSVRATPFVLEVGAGANAKGIAEELERAKAHA
jgi:hypothetical protein